MIVKQKQHKAPTTEMQRKKEVVREAFRAYQEHLKQEEIDQVNFNTALEEDELDHEAFNSALEGYPYW